MTEEENPTIKDIEQAIELYVDKPLSRPRLLDLLNYFIMYSGRKVNDRTLNMSHRLAWGRLTATLMGHSIKALRDDQLDTFEKRLKVIEAKMVGG